MRLSQLFESVSLKTPSELGISTVFRTEKPDKYFKGKAIWGKGKYFSLSRTDSEKINAGTDDDIIEIRLPDTLNLIEFDLTWKDSKRSDQDYETLHSLIDNPPANVDGFVVRSNSLQYGFSQVVIFPQAQTKLS